MDETSAVDVPSMTTRHPSGRVPSNKSPTMSPEAYMVPGGHGLIPSQLPSHVWNRLSGMPEKRCMARATSRQAGASPTTQTSARPRARAATRSLRASVTAEHPVR